MARHRHTELREPLRYLVERVGIEKAAKMLGVKQVRTVREWIKAGPPAGAKSAAISAHTIRGEIKKEIKTLAEQGFRVQPTHLEKQWGFKSVGTLDLIEKKTLRLVLGLTNKKTGQTEYRKIDVNVKGHKLGAKIAKIMSNPFDFLPDSPTSDRKLFIQPSSQAGMRDLLVAAIQRPI